jgi:hypothetical protein
MEVDEKPTEDYSDIGGLDKQIQVRYKMQGECTHLAGESISYLDQSGDMFYAAV